MKRIKNSVIGKCLQVLLIGYFLISSLHISNTFNGYIAENTEVHSTDGLVNQILKKLFNCNGCPEELDDYESKTEKTSKGLLLNEYILPCDNAISYNNTYTELKDKIYIANSIFLLGFYSKIHLPPPEII